MAAISALSASVTRILYLTGFPKELKTKDIQSAFSEYENNNGGFKIKWKDDTSLLIVFQDAAVAKRAYLQTVAFPPAILTTSSTGTTATIRPYDGPDAQTVIQTVNSRGQHAHNPSRGHNNRAASISVFPARSNSGTGGTPNGRNGHHVTLSHVNTNGTIPEHPHSNGGREPSPTLPNLPSHPTLNELINSAVSPPPEDPAILHAEGPPRIGDPGKRMLSAALGVRHPGLGPRTINSGNGNGTALVGEGGVRGADQALREVQRAMGGLSVAE